MKRIIIHCGFPKTGSSAIQVQLARGRETLRKHNLDYLRLGDFELGRQGKISSGNGVNIARSFLPPSHPDSLAHRRQEILELTLRAFQETEKDVLLSSEFFSAIPGHLMGTLCSEFSKEGCVELVYFVRDQVSLMAANYMQQVKRHKLTQYPSEYFSCWDSFKSSLDYYKRLTNLVQYTDGVRLHVDCYENSKNHKNGLIGLLFDKLGIPFDQSDYQEDTPVNLSPSVNELKLLIEANKHNPRMQFSDLVVENSARSGRSAVHASHDILPLELRRAIREYFKEGNARLFAEFIGSSNRYSDPITQENYIDISAVEFDTSDLVAIVTSFLVEIDRRIAILESKDT